MSSGKHLALLVTGACAFFGSLGVAEGACSSSGNTLTCTGGPAAAVQTDGNSGNTIQGSPYPSTITVSGAPGGATVASVVLKINGYTAKIGTAGICAANFCFASSEVGMLLEGPVTGGVKPNLQVLANAGAGNSAQTNTNFTLQDGGATIPSGDGNTTAWSGSGTWAPTANSGVFRTNNVSPSYSPTGPSSFTSAPPIGAATTTPLKDAFAGKNVNGAWNLYLVTDAPNKNNDGADISFTSWEIDITYSSASSPSTTTLSSSLSTPFTNGNSSSVTLTATVTAGATGTVTFKDGTNSLTCSGGNPATLSSGAATCVTTFSAEGVHQLSAGYSGDSNFVSSTGSANIYAQNHATNSGTTYCNAGAISSNGHSDLLYTNTAPYPSTIFVGDGVNTDIAGNVSNVSVQLKGFTGNFFGSRFLLVAPDNTHAFDFISNVFGAPSPSGANYTFQDGSTPIPSSNTTGSSVPAGTYGPSDYNNQTDAFTPGPPTPAPQVPGSFGTAAPFGTATFLTSFNGALAHGAWKLFMSDIGGTAASEASGWCLTITAATGKSTTTTVTSSANPNAVLGASVSFTATISSSPTAPNIGTVTFEENGSPLTGAPNSGVANVSNGTATIATTSLPEGDHTITATFHDSTNTFNDSFGTVTIRIDKATGTPTLTGSTWTYCNTAGITIPAGALSLNDIGPAGPNPSNVMVTNLPGTISTASITLNAFKHFNPSTLQSLLVGPNGASLPTSSQTLDFFTNTGTIGFGPQNTTFIDTGSAVFSGPPAASQKPESFSTTPTFTASPFFTLPSTIQRAASAGSATFASAFNNSNPNGVWSVYFDQTTHQDAHSGNGANDGATSWCMNFIVSAVTGTGTTSHVGPAPNNHMRQGGTGTVSFSLLNNGDSNSKGSTGDPDQTVAHAMTVTGTLPSGLTLGTVPTGTPWNCTANTTTQVTCTNLNAIAQGSTYTPLAIPVIVASNAGPSVVVSGFTFSGAGMNAGTFSSDTITIDPAPILAIAKTHSGTFTQGSTTAVWTLQVTNTSATAAGATDGSTVTVTDALPSGWIISSVVAGNTWNCASSTTTAVLCTTTAVVAGNNTDFEAITVNVTVPANAAVSTSNTGKVFGGGDLTHTNSGNAAFKTDTVTVVQVPATISLTAGNNQTVAVNTAFPTMFSVTVLDGGNLPISGASVTFTAPASGASGKFANNTITTTTTTNASGVANATTYTSNGTAGGPYNVSVTAGPITNNFSETNIAGPATQMSANTGTTPQSATVSTAFTNALAVTLKDAANNPVSGVTVTFTAPGNGASARFTNNTASIQVITNGSGVAAAPATAGTIAGGPYTVTAAAGGLTNVNFSLTNLAGAAATMATNTGTTPQSAAISTAFANALAVTVKDSLNNPVSGVNVTFTAPGSGASGVFGNSTATITVPTNASGIASAPFTANTTIGSYLVTAAASGLTTVSFSLSNTVGAPANMTANPGTTPQSATVNTAFTNALAVTVTDAGSNPVSGVSVIFTAPGSGASGTFSNSTATITVPTNASGVAAASFTANGTAGGAYTVTAAKSGLTTVNFSLTNNAAGPVVTTNPVDVTVNAGATATFTAAASGTPTPTVQWQFSTDGGTSFSNLGGATTTTLSVPNVTAAQNGTKYRAVFTNSGGSATTTAATLTVNFAPTVTTNPVNQSVTAGSNVSFTAAASGNPTPAVQWQVSSDGGANFSNVSGATSTTLSFTTSSGQNSNQYRAVFTNTVGSATTTAATLTVTAGPVVTTNPVDVTVNAGGTATFTAAASGTPTPTVQWQFSTDGGASFSNLGGATTTTLSVPNVTSAQNGTKYRAVFTNSGGSATTTAATLTVNFAPTVTTNPVNQSVTAGSNVSFTAAASGNPTPTVQWQVSSDGGATFSNVSGATSTTLSFTTSSGQNGNQYRAVFTNTVGSATTTAATLTVTAGPVITTNPLDVSVNAGGTATFTAAASGTPTPTVQWQFSTDGGTSFSNLGGATTTTLTVPNVTSAQNGTKYRAVFTNSGGSATTTAATLTVNFAPTVTTNPVNQSVTAGSNATFTAAASGNPTPTVQWQVSTDGGSNFSNVSGATSTTLSFTTSSGQNGNQYRAVFTNTVESATTTAATLTVTAGPVITLNPVNVTVSAGATATFTANATGTPTPTVQWQVSTDGGANFSNLSGATTTTLSFTATTGMNGNQYRAVFTNGGGSATTTAATLTVNAAPTVVSFKVLWGNQSYNVTGSPRNRLPWQITGIQVVFSAPITSGTLNSLGGGVTPTAFSGLGTNTLTWTINPVTDGQITATLAGSGANALKDGNNTALGGGSGASQVLRILYGDFNDDGFVNAADLSGVLAATQTSYNLFADLNGDGVVNVTDAQIVRTQIGNTLP